MAVYNSNIKELRAEIAKSQTQMQNAIADAEQRIKNSRFAKAGTSEFDDREANKVSLRDAKRVLKALDVSFAELRYACCENDLSCNVEVLAPSRGLAAKKVGKKKKKRS